MFFRCKIYCSYDYIRKSLLKFGDKGNTVSIDRLKPMKSSGNVTTVQPRRHGRLPRLPPLQQINHVTVDDIDVPQSFLPWHRFGLVSADGLHFFCLPHRIYHVAVDYFPQSCTSWSSSSTLTVSSPPRRKSY